MTDPVERTSTLRRSVALWLAFVVLVVISVFTVLLPELEDDSDSDEGAAESAAAPESS